jgi:hypothetical protein
MRCTRSHGQHIAQLPYYAAYHPGSEQHDVSNVCYICDDQPTQTCPTVKYHGGSTYRSAKPIPLARTPRLAVPLSRCLIQQAASKSVALLNLCTRSEVSSDWAAAQAEEERNWPGSSPQAPLAIVQRLEQDKLKGRGMCHSAQAATQRMQQSDIILFEVLIDKRGIDCKSRAVHAHAVGGALAQRLSLYSSLAASQCLRDGGGSHGSGRAMATGACPAHCADSRVPDCGRLARRSGQPSTARISCAVYLAGLKARCEALLGAATPRGARATHGGALGAAPAAGGGAPPSSPWRQDWPARWR